MTEGEPSTVRLGTRRPSTASERRLPVVDPAHYAHRRELTEGGMGRILTAIDKRLGREVAIKELRVQGDELRARFEREALLTARLQHPSIVSIHEAGVWPDGEPFFAMKLVPGRSLDRVVAAAPTLDDRLALVPHVLAVADALAYAHDRRVIHRDLKPQNVIVGDFGETVVIDWGLGKDLDDKLPDGDGVTTAREPDPDATAAGDVIGTPSYMPPEQAEGRPVDERADVYALGAILYSVLAGERPYKQTPGTDQRALLDAVRGGPPVPLDDKQPGVPRDLLAIVERAMSREPAQRYPTARELADDLRRFLRGQLVAAHRYSLPQLARRWLRRHRAAVTVAAIALVATVALAAYGVVRILAAQQRAEDERVIAEHSREAAEQHRRDAEDLVKFMLGDLRERLQAIGKVEVLAVVAGKIRDYYRKRPEALLASDQIRRGLARRALGDVLLAQGDPMAALVEHRAALALFEGRTPDVAGDAVATTAPAPEPPEDRVREAAIAHHKIGDALLAVDDPRGALAEYRLAQRTFSERAQHDRSHEAQRELMAALQRVGDALAQLEDLGGALAVYQESEVIARRELAAAPDEVGRRRDITLVQDRLGSLLLQRGDADAALVHYRAGLATARELRALRPDNPSLLHDLVLGHLKIGDVHRAKNDGDQAIAEYRIAQALAEELIRRDDSNIGWKRDLGGIRDLIGDILLARDRAAEALVEFEAVRVTRNQIALAAPAYAGDLTASHDRIGRAAIKLQRWDLALAAFRGCAEILEKLVISVQQPERGLYACRESAGDVLVLAKRGAEALPEYRAALVALEAFVAKHPTVAEYRRDLALLHARLAEQLAATRDHSAAVASYRAALAIAEQLRAASPGDDTANADLGELQLGLGEALAAAGEREAALAAYRTAVAAFERVKTLQPPWAELAAAARAKLR